MNATQIIAALKLPPSSREYRRAAAHLKQLSAASAMLEGAKANALGAAGISYRARAFQAGANSSDEQIRKLIRHASAGTMIEGFHQ